jgi:transcriptional regulator with XRE-family HTH domain
VPRGQPDPRLGAVVRQAREDAQQSQQAVAYRAGLSMSTYTRFELGQSDASWSTVIRVCDALPLSLVELGRRIEAENRG